MERITGKQWVGALLKSLNNLDDEQFMGSYINDRDLRVCWTQVDTPEFEYVYICAEHSCNPYYMGSK